jgi:hypothetical protein
VQEDVRLAEGRLAVGRGLFRFRRLVLKGLAIQAGKAT